MSKITILPIHETPRIRIRCATCDKNDMDEFRGRFPICDECIEALHTIIKGIRPPKVVEIGPTIPGGSNESK